MDREKLRELKEALDLEQVQVILFGSRARGDFYPDSDWDIAIISPEFEGLNRGQRYQNVWRVVRRFVDGEYDIVTYTPEEYEKGKDGSLPEHIEKEGIKV